MAQWSQNKRSCEDDARDFHIESITWERIDDLGSLTYPQGMKTYTGGCHCGAVKYEVNMELGEVLSCNCSLCAKMGSLLKFVPIEEFKLLSGEDVLVDYQFNKKIIHHVFCPTCGIHSFSRAELADGKSMAAINVRCLDDIDVAELPVKYFDGKNK
jgi:hypothetical protein